MTGWLSPTNVANQQLAQNSFLISTAIRHSLTMDFPPIDNDHVPSDDDNPSDDDSIDVPEGTVEKEMKKQACKSEIEASIKKDQVYATPNSFMTMFLSWPPSTTSQSARMADPSSVPEESVQVRQRRGRRRLRLVLPRGTGSHSGSYAPSKSPLATLRSFPNTKEPRKTSTKNPDSQMSARFSLFVLIMGLIVSFPVKSCRQHSGEVATSHNVRLEALPLLST